MSDLDPEEVRRALEGEYHDCGLMNRVAFDWLRLREQPAPDVQAQIASLSEQIHDMRRAHQAQIDATDDGVCPRHGCAVCEECAIDAAVARERALLVEIANIAHHGRLIGKDENDIRRLTLPYWDQDECSRLQMIRARAKGA